MLVQVERRHKGQVLVLVALAVLVLAAVVALAVDGGNVYAERRKMQNAADAAALAGARVLCFEDDASDAAVEAEANRYATSLNAAQSAIVSIDRDQLTVAVAVNETADTFFARVIGFDTVDVAADATAKCNRAVKSGNIWPLTIEVEAFNEIPCDTEFYAFVSKNEDVDDTELGKINCDECECDIEMPGGDIVRHIGRGNRGWLRLFEPPSYFDDPCPQHNCGAEELICWLDNGHPGPVSIGDCLPGKPGVVSSVDRTINEEGELGSIYNLVLFDKDLLSDCTDDNTLGTCPGSRYYVGGFGCIEVERFEKNHPFPYTQQNRPYGTCDKTTRAHIVVVTKRCGTVCESSGGTDEGEGPAPQDVRSVTLIE